MKIILLENVRKVGSIGEIIDVKGLAKLPNISKKALFASKENIKEVEKIKSDLNKKIKIKNIAKDNEKLKGKEFAIAKLSTENRELYGSVKPTEISKMLSEIENIDINPSMVQPVKEIKSLGSFDIILNLHSEIQSKIKIKVVNKEEE